LKIDDKALKNFLPFVRFINVPLQAD